MKRVLFFLLFLSLVKDAISQPALVSPKKYQGLLWEITGNGMKKPSYLFGTMHVSNKLAFHLADSFYIAIKSVDVVALETNPANWQDDYSNSSGFNNRNSYEGANMMESFFDFPSSYLHINTFAIDGYENKIRHALVAEPSIINGMLYRTYENGADFEEDTYLDMYIFQTGSKLKKRMTGVENFQESEKLVAEAYKDAAKDKTKKGSEPDNNNDDNGKAPYTIEDAYRKGDLDLLDSIEIRQLGSKAFLEKFLYRRNEIQANSIDSILKAKSSLFVAVGSAHLPGNRGVIELLRTKGYTLRPVKMGDRDSRQKDLIDKTRVPVLFHSVTAEDSTFSVEIPGKKLYNFNKSNDLISNQYADMGNGVYYMVSRVKTNSLLKGETIDKVYKKTDSLLYENIPGKIISKTPVIKNGFRGFDITNRTRRGDIQRYNIFITPFEILIFKISGIGNYVQEGEEAKRFFSSVSIRETHPHGWLNFQPSTGGFNVKMPHVPILQKDNENARLEYTAYDNKENIVYSLFKAAIHNYNFIGEDSFDLNLMQESFASSEMVEKELSHRQGVLQGYPVLDCNYKNKDGSFSRVRYLLQGPLYYVQVARFNYESNNVRQYFDSFRITPFHYPIPMEMRDTAMHFTVRSPLPLESKKQHDLMEGIHTLMDNYTGDELIPEFGFHTISNDSIGEKVYVVYIKGTRDTYIKDSVHVFGNYDVNPLGGHLIEGNDYIVKKDSGLTAGGARFFNIQATDTGSSRMILSKSFYKNGNFFSILSITDTLTARSSLLAGFFQTFTPDDNVTGESPFAKKNKRFFTDLASTDSAVRAHALSRLPSLDMDSESEPSLVKIIDTLTWKTRDYLRLKQTFIAKLGEIKDEAMVDYYKRLYADAKDTADLQNAILKALVTIQTRKSLMAFRELIISEPPVVADESKTDYAGILSSIRNITRSFSRRNSAGSGNDGIWSLLYDSLSLTKVLFPDILELINLDDYKNSIMSLLTTMVDSGYLDPKVYEPYFDKFYTEGRHELKKERAAERQKEITNAAKANQSDEEDKASGDDKDYGNPSLNNYAVLLLPYSNKNTGVRSFFDDLMKLKSERERFITLLLLLRNNKPVADSVVNSFASRGKYRMELYRALKEKNQLKYFPAKYNNQSDLVQSALVNMNFSDEKYDSLAFLDKLPLTYKHARGVVYFFKYKSKKSDRIWKIIPFGMQPADSTRFDDDNTEFTESSQDYDRKENKLDETKPLREQLQKKLNNMLIKKHPAAKMFYNDDKNGYLNGLFRSNHADD